MSVPAGTPALTRMSNCTTADWSGASVPCPAPGSGGVRSDELMFTPAISGETPPSGWPTGNPFSVSRVRDVGRVRRHRVAQHDAGRRDRAGVVDRDRVAQHVARIDDARRAVVDLQRRALVREQQRQVADDVARRIVQRPACPDRRTDSRRCAVTALTNAWFEITVPSRRSDRRRRRK